MDINIKEILANAAFPIIKAVGKAEVDQVLRNIKAHNTPEVYANALKAGHGFFALLDTAAVKTKTKLDDGMIDIFQQAIEEAAADDDITL